MIDGGPAGHLLVDRTDGTRCDQLTAVSGHARTGVFEAELERTREIPDRYLELVIGDAIADQSIELGTHQFDDVVTVLGLCACIHLEGAAVGIRGHSGIHRIGEAATFPDLLEQPARQPSAEHLVDNVERFAIFVAARQ